MMAFIGIGVFWVSLPKDPVAPYSMLSYLPLTIRPVGMLFFVEAIAWFLLRQYRALIEDYKIFHKVYLRRANFLVALQISESKNVTKPELAVAAALLSDDLSTRLKRGETTEGLESVRQVDANPVFDLFSKIIDRAVVPVGGAKAK